MRAAAKEALGTGSPVWHIHNHSLGKNAAFAEVVAKMAEEGEALLLQIHDFAEDGRPENYRSIPDPSRLYPVGGRVGYAFLNSRDREMMVAAGLPRERAHFLPNPVVPPELPEGCGAREADGPLVLYPVRGIRRKNLGEIMLLAALSPPGGRFAVTLGAENPQWRPVHDGWRKFGEEARLPVALEVVGRLAPAPGADPSFIDWLCHATHLVTTSVAEGFGLAFLEPAALGKPLFGRDLPEITRDFRAEGIQPGRLYRRLLVPESWIDAAALRGELARTLTTVLGAYGREAGPDVVEATWRALHFPPAHLDFANLPESFQRRVVETAARNPGEVLVEIGDGLRPAADWLAETLAATQPTAGPEQLAAYAPEAYGKRLASLFEAVESEAPAPLSFLPAGAVLDAFLAPERFHFLRT
jgi:hypothetical protein